MKPVREGLFGEDDERRPYLIGGHCRECGRLQFPVAPTCPVCGSDAIETVHLSGHGTLWGWTAVTAPPPGYLGDVPFGFGVVALSDGLLVITRIEEPDPNRLESGMAMQLELVELGADDEGDVVTTYSFAPAKP
ncbi:MAG TPA: OB-fold domain-containing protein [Acidimicrobiia bacterium]